MIKYTLEPCWVRPSCGRAYKKNKPANKYHILILVRNMGGIKLEIALRPVASLGALYQT